MYYSILLILMLANQPKIGFGLGQTLGRHLLTPSQFTMRVPLGESFVISPELKCAYSSSDAEIDSVSSSDFIIGLEGNLHYAIFKKDNTCFYGIGGIGFKISRDTKNWYEHSYLDSLVEIKEISSYHSYGINLGLGMEHFLKDNLSIYISSLSDITTNYEETERKENGEKETIERKNYLSLNLQNLKSCIYLIWYIL